MDSNTRLRVATRIHFALLRLLGETVEVGHILHREDQTREVLWVCEGSGDEELMALAAQYRQAQAAERAASQPASIAAAPAARPQAPLVPSRPIAKTSSRPNTAHPPQEAAWSNDTSGFGVSRPPELGDEPRGGSADKPSTPWLQRMRWRRGNRPIR